MPLPPNPSAFSAPVAPAAEVAPAVEATGPTTVLVQPPGPAAPLPSALATPSLAAAPAPIKAAVGGTPALLTNGFMAGTGNPDIPGIAIGVNVLIEWFKNRKFFHEQVWTIPLLFVLSFGIALVIWFLINHDLQEAITKGFSILGTAHLNYTSSKAAGIPVLAPTKEENRWRPA